VEDVSGGDEFPLLAVPQTIIRFGDAGDGRFFFHFLRGKLTFNW
jgi:hypothetical protein